MREDWVGGLMSLLEYVLDYLPLGLGSVVASYA